MDDVTPTQLQQLAEATLVALDNAIHHFARRLIDLMTMRNLLAMAEGQPKLAIDLHGFKEEVETLAEDPDEVEAVEKIAPPVAHGARRGPPKGRLRSKTVDRGRRLAARLTERGPMTQQAIVEFLLLPYGTVGDFFHIGWLERTEDRRWRLSTRGREELLPMGTGSGTV